MIKAQIYTEDIFSVYMIYSNGECIECTQYSKPVNYDTIAEEIRSEFGNIPIEYLGDTFIPITSSECYIKP